MFSIPNDKASRVDGYNSMLFKAAWEIIGDYISTAVPNFFKTGKILKELNVTSITLIPKVESPDIVGDFRPI